MVELVYKEISQYLPKLQRHLSFNSAIPLYNKLVQVPNNTWTRLFIDVPLVMAKDWQQLKCPSKGDYLYVVLCLCSLQKDEENTHILRRKDLQDTRLKEKSKALSSMYSFLHFVYLWGTWV